MLARVVEWPATKITTIFGPGGKKVAHHCSRPFLHGQRAEIPSALTNMYYFSVYMNLIFRASKKLSQRLEIR